VEGLQYATVNVTVSDLHVLALFPQLENTAIANAWQLAAPVVFRFNYDAHVCLPRFKSVNLSAAVLYHFTDDTLHYAMTLTFDTVTLTFDPLTLDICNVGCNVVTVPNLNEFEQSVITISIFDPLKMSRVALRSGIIFSKFSKLSLPIRSSFHELIEQGLTSHQTHYRYRGRFLQVI